MKDLIITIGIILGLICACTYILSGASIVSKSAEFTFYHTLECDSAIAHFGYNPDGIDTLNLYDTVKMTPYFTLDSSFLGGIVTLDSIGTHTVRITYYEQGAGAASGYFMGIWECYDDTNDIKTLFTNNMADSTQMADLTKVAMGDTLELINHTDSSSSDMQRLILAEAILDSLSADAITALWAGLLGKTVHADYYSTDSLLKFGYLLLYKYYFLKDSLVRTDSIGNMLDTAILPTYNVAREHALFNGAVAGYTQQFYPRGSDFHDSTITKITDGSLRVLKITWGRNSGDATTLDSFSVQDSATLNP